MKPGDLVLAHASEIETEPSLFRRIEPILHRACIVRDVVLDEALVNRFPEVADETPISVPIELLLSVHNGVVPSKHRQRRALVYLDQCVLSELVKYTAGRLGGAHAEAACELLAALDEAVFQKQTAICVESSFHRQEASGLASSARGLDLLEKTFQFLCLRSRHLRLLEHREMLRNQALQQIALATNATVLPAEFLWKTGLSRDPDETNAKTGMFGGHIVVGVAWQPVESPPMLAAGLERERAEGSFGDFSAELEKCKQLSRARALNLHKWQPWHRYWGEGGGGISNRAVTDFLASEAFFDLPYNYCADRLTASLLSEKNRQFRDSDYVDLRFVARALPYSDLMLVDANLKNRIQSQKLDRRFSTHVLSARLSDYREAAKWLRARSVSG